MRRLRIAIGIGLLAAIGCEGSIPTTTTAQIDGPAAPAPPTPAAPSAQPQVAAQPSQEPQPPSAPAQAPPMAQPPIQQSAPANNAVAEDAELKKADVGAGVKGHYSAEGIILTPIATKFRIEENIAFNIQIPQAMNLYKAEHNNKGPKTHDEFMRVIIQESGVSLPELRPGESYVYDPESEQLMISSPKPQ